MFCLNQRQGLKGAQLTIQLTEAEMKKWTFVPVHSYFALIVFLLCYLSSSIDCSGNCAKGRKRSWSCRRPWVTCRSTSSRNVNMCWGSMLKMTGWRSVHGSLRMTHWQTEGQSMVHWEWHINRLKVSPWFTENNRWKVSPWFTENDTLTNLRSVHDSLRMTDWWSVHLFAENNRLKVSPWFTENDSLKISPWFAEKETLTDWRSVHCCACSSSIIVCFSPVCSLDCSFFKFIFMANPVIILLSYPESVF